VAYLTRTDPAKNINRFYIICLDPSLFGWSLTREWGRRGKPGRMIVSTFGSYQDAEKEQRRTLRRRLRHGYTERSDRSRQ
jgi:predicted DNA-binding WGR domain protein